MLHKRYSYKIWTRETRRYYFVSRSCVFYLFVIFFVYDVVVVVPFFTTNVILNIIHTSVTSF